MPRLCSSLLLSLFIVSVMLVRPARAILIELDDPVFGPGSITRDTDTALDWLDVPISVGRSYNDVSTQFGPGGDFEGFRYAERVEIRALMVSVGIDTISGSAGDAASYEPARYLQGLLGTTESGPDYRFTVGVSGTERTLGNLFGTRIESYDVTQMGNAEDFEVWMAPDEVGSFGHYLVRAVPEPGTGLLVIAGLLGLARSSRA